jgi:hypothetical protein
MESIFIGGRNEGEDDDAKLNKDARPSPFPLVAEADPGPAVSPRRAAAEQPWKAAYQKLMTESIRTADVLFRSSAWHALDDDPQQSGIQLYEASYGETYGFHSLKAHAMLDVRAERLMHIIRDHEVGTRMKWDSLATTACEEIEQIALNARETIRVVRSEVVSGLPRVWPRSLLGIDWWCYNGNSRIYKYVFRTTQHREVAANKQGVVAMIGLIALLIRVIERSRCELILVLNVNPGDSFPTVLANLCKPWLRERVALYQRVAQQWDQYYGSGAK